MLRQQQCKYCCSSSSKNGSCSRTNENKIHRIYSYVCICQRILDIFPCVYVCVLVRLPVFICVCLRALKRTKCHFKALHSVHSVSSQVYCYYLCILI